MQDQAAYLNRLQDHLERREEAVKQSEADMQQKSCNARELEARIMQFDLSIQVQIDTVLSSGAVQRCFTAYHHFSTTRKGQNWRVAQCSCLHYKVMLERYISFLTCCRFLYNRLTGECFWTYHFPMLLGFFHLLLIHSRSQSSTACACCPSGTCLIEKWSRKKIHISLWLHRNNSRSCPSSIMKHLTRQNSYQGHWNL